MEKRRAAGEKTFQKRRLFSGLEIVGLRRGVSIVSLFNQLVFFRWHAVCVCVGGVCGSSAQKGISLPLSYYMGRFVRRRYESLYSGGKKNKGGPTAGDEEGGSQTGRKFNSLLHTSMLTLQKWQQIQKKLIFFKK